MTGCADMVYIMFIKCLAKVEMRRLREFDDITSKNKAF